MGLKNHTGTLPAVGPFSPTGNARRTKVHPPRATERCITVKYGDKPGNRRVVLSPSEVFWAFSRGAAV